MRFVSWLVGLLLLVVGLPTFAHYYFTRVIANPTSATSTVTGTPSAPVVTTQWRCITAAGATIPSGGPFPTKLAAETPCGTAVAADGVTRFLEESVTTTTNVPTTTTVRTRREEVLGGSTLKVSAAHAAMLMVAPGGGGGAPSGELLWEGDFETGDLSQYDGAGSGSISAVTNGTSYQGSYHAVIALANGSTNDFGDFKVYGTAGNLGTQITSPYCAQIASSFDSFTGGWPSSTQKIAIFQYYDVDDASYSNAFRKYQQILSIGNDGEYFVELIEWNNATGMLVQTAVLSQGATTYGPGDSFGYWDVLRMCVTLDTNGDSTLGSGHGNGAMQVWLNNELIINYSDVNFVESATDVGMGRIFVASRATDNWPGTATSQYFDAFQVASAASVLDAMPNDPVLRDVGGDDNPDGITEGSVLFSFDYETEVGAQFFNSGGGQITGDWDAASGYGGGGAWTATPTPTTGAVGSNEDNAGWAMPTSGGSNFPADGYELIVVSYMLYVSQALIGEIQAHNGFWNNDNKALDFKYWDSAGTAEGDRHCFFFGLPDADPSDVQWQFGQCGGPHINPPPSESWMPLGDQWVWVAHVIDMRGATSATRYLSTYYKTASGNVTQALHQFENELSGDSVLLSYDGRGFHGFGNCNCLWGYWDDMVESDLIEGMVADFEVRVDRVRISDGWPTGADGPP